MRGRVARAVVLGLIAVGVAACSTGTGSSYRYDGSTTVGQTIPIDSRRPVGDVHGTLLAGGQFDIHDDSGAVTVLNLWGAWCGPCKVEVPQYDQLYRELHPSGVDFVGLDVKEVSRTDPTSFIADNEISYPNVYDPSAKTALQIGKLPTVTVGLPWTVVVDKHGRVAAVYVGEQQPADLRPVLQGLVAEP
jgi:thiol-disulfide isomerase/thioredoxin